MTNPASILPTIKGVAADVGERAAKTFAQTLLAYFGAGALDVLHADWTTALSLAGGAAVLSVLSSFVSLPIGQGGTASLTDAVVPLAVLDAVQYGKHARAVQPPAVQQEPTPEWTAEIKTTRPTPYPRGDDSPVTTMFRLGRLPNDPSKPRVRLTALEAPKAALTPPPAVDWYSKVPLSSWGMDGNDRVGDCTCAEVDHCVKALQVAAGNAEVKSSDAEVLSLYSAVTGYNPNDPNTDRGAMMQDVRNYWRKNGVTLGGSKHSILLFAQVDHTDHNLIKWCIAHFGEVGIGFNFPASAMSQFNAGKPWTVVAGSKVEGGHAVGAVGYDTDYVYVTTWGSMQKMAWAFFDKYVDECWTQLSSEFVNAASGDDALGETLYALGQQYAAITGQANPIPAPGPSPQPQPSPSPAPAIPANWVAWAKHVITLKHQTEATLTVAREILAAAGE